MTGLSQLPAPNTLQHIPRLEMNSTKKRRSPKHDLIQHPHATAYLGDVKWDLLSVGTERRGKYLLKRVDYYAADIITVFMHKVT